MRECSSCQTVNDNSAQFCLECGQKLAPVGRGSAPDEQVPSAPSGRPRLHSPILGGYEDIDDAPRKQEKPKNTAPRAKGAHLRSPLLGGSDADDDDDEEVFDDTAMKSSKGRAPQSKPGGKMRSPLFGKSGPSSDDDYEEDFPLRDRNTDRSPFPHRSRPREADPGTPAPQQHAPQQSSGKAHLRSPLLGGSDADDFEEEQFSPPAGRKQQQQPGNSRPQKLKSPMFDRASGSGSYDDYDDEEVDDVDDPNVLRSPLLAAKSRLPQGRTNQNQPRPYPPNDAPQMQRQGAPGMQPGAEQQGYNQQAQQATYSQQQANQQAFGAPQTGQQQPMQQGQQANQLQPQQQIQQPQLAQPPMGQISPQSGQAAFGAQGQNNQPVFAPAPPINPNASANGLQSVTFPGQAGQSNQSPQSAQSNYSGQPNQPNQSAQLDQPYEYGAPGASLPGGPSSPFPSSNQSSQGSTMMESPIQPQQLAPQSPPPTPFAPQSSAPAVQSTKTPIFPTVVSGTTSGASNQLLNDDEFVEHSAVTDLSPLPKPKPAKLGGGRFAQPAPASDDDNDDLSSSHTGRGLPLSAQQPISRKRPGALGAVSDDHDHHPGSNAAAPSTPIMVIFVTGFLGAIAKGYFLFSFWKQFAASMPMLVDQLGQLAIFVGLIIFAMQGSRK